MGQLSTLRLPLQEYFELVDDHLQCRHALAELLDSLAKRAHQLRVIEKRCACNGHM